MEFAGVGNWAAFSQNRYAFLVFRHTVKLLDDRGVMRRITFRMFDDKNKPRGPSALYEHAPTYAREFWRRAKLLRIDEALVKSGWFLTPVWAVWVLCWGLAIAGLSLGFIFLCAAVGELAFGTLFLLLQVGSAILLLAALGLVPDARGRARHQIPPFQARLAAHHCPTCNYSLADLRAESDGCTTCPECASGWRLLTDAMLAELPQSGAMHVRLRDARGVDAPFLRHVPIDEFPQSLAVKDTRRNASRSWMVLATVLLGMLVYVVLNDHFPRGGHELLVYFSSTIVTGCCTHLAFSTFRFRMALSQLVATRIRSNQCPSCTGSLSRDGEFSRCYGCGCLWK